MSLLDFVVKKEYHFLQNIFSKEELAMLESICDLEAYYKHFKMFIYICAHLCVKYNKKSSMENVTDEKNINFIVNAQVSDFEALFQEISEMKIKGINLEGKNKRNQLRNSRLKTVLYVYRETFHFQVIREKLAFLFQKILRLLL